MTHEFEIDFEAEYNCRAMVPEHPQLIEQWGRDAAAFRAGANVELDAKYGPDARHCIDIFTPVTDRNGPVAMFVHGGYWSNFDGKWFSHMASGMVAHGIPVAVPSYRLCPEVQIADIIADIRQACAWLHRRFGRQVLPVGHSAGGHLAAALLATDWPAHNDEMPPDLVKAAVSISGL
ncbi:MAG: alpha/beta hydrolase, partial [Hyphomicrobiales bacterium]